MKRAIITMLFIFLAAGAIAQKIRFTDTTNRWDIYWFDSGHPPGQQTDIRGLIRYFYNGAEWINGKEYRVLMTKYKSQPVTIAAYIREDTLSNRVYKLLPNSPDEKLVYNFNAVIGDTFGYSALYSLPLILDSIDSVQINSYWHKVFKFRYSSPVTSTDDYKVVEGIGCVQDLTIPIYDPEWSFGRNSLICFHNQGVVPQTTFPYLNSCKDTVVHIAEQNIREIKGLAYPQPAVNAVIIELPHEVESGIFSLFSVTGQLVYTHRFENTNRLKVRNQNWHGIYFYKATSNDGNCLSGKLVFE